MRHAQDTSFNITCLSACKNQYNILHLTSNRHLTEDTRSIISGYWDIQKDSHHRQRQYLYNSSFKWPAGNKSLLIDTATTHSSADRTNLVTSTIFDSSTQQTEIDMTIFPELTDTRIRNKIFDSLSGNAPGKIVLKERWSTWSKLSASLDLELE